MCGIVGCVLKNDKVAPILLDSISKLEYRGYDSIGLATACDGKINLKKDAGKIEEVDSKLNFADMPGTYGIAHVRWATHGDPSKENSHPHSNSSGTIAVVHNGIIENYLAIKEDLISEGYEFKSNTDTEVIPHLLDKFMKEGLDLEKAVRKVIGVIEGALRANNGGRSFIRWLRNEKVIGKEIPDNIISWLCENSIVMDDLRFILDRMSVVQIYNYVRRQSAELNMKPKDVIGIWADYLSMAARLKMDTNDAIIYRVRMLKKRHDELVERCKLQDMEIRAGEVLLKYPHIEDIYDSIRSLYAYEDKTYSVLIPSKLEEIIKEGEQLHHCVGCSERYWDRIERRESYVLFLRHTSEPDKPYYTLEVEPDGTVRQKRTMYDRQEPDIELAKKFLRQWQRVVSTRLTATERKLAVVSQELRMQEFEELKREKVIIHTGDFYGRSLLDLLTEDLMENTNVVAEPVLAAAA